MCITNVLYIWNSQYNKKPKWNRWSHCLKLLFFRLLWGLRIMYFWINNKLYFYFYYFFLFTKHVLSASLDNWKEVCGSWIWMTFGVTLREVLFGSGLILSFIFVWHSSTNAQSIYNVPEKKKSIPVSKELLFCRTWREKQFQCHEVSVV